MVGDDSTLLNNACKHGAGVTERTRVRRVDLDASEGLVKVDEVRPRDGNQTYHASVLILYPHLAIPYCS